ncbi:MORN repeat-containing protein 3 [Erpetoichthys calabaricus]|uniref:MORN repeat-containing protein 3 n=1 Tax=Erpetoichthys calabaricus TaxID=27687 RepID=A0A8C4TJR9_ERPCA|nr:MORN repeat-containing protein 3 [Erpetoichthys calabaricus]
MPHLMKSRQREPLWTEWDKKAQKSGLRHTVYYVGGDKYTGEWLDNKKHGKGTEFLKKSGEIYDGDWKNGKRSGFGTLSAPDPVTAEYVKVHSGGWKNGMKDGFGTYFYSNGEHYEGEWSKDQRSGWGRMYFKDGSIYEGEWLHDKHDGQGMLRLENENRYEGSWKNGKKHGPGKFFYLDKGQLYEGVWAEDVAKCGSMIDFGREGAPAPTQYPIPKVHLADPTSVLNIAQSNLISAQE